MSYQEFGLDAVKKSQDKGEHSKTFYDPWSWQQVRGKNFYLCFANWVISRSTIEVFQEQHPDVPLDDDSCIKCHRRDIPLHYRRKDLNLEGTPVGICADCVKWAAEYLDKEAPIKPGTQIPLF